MIGSSNGYPEPICMVCEGHCDVSEEVHVGGGAGWELWCYCAACDIETFHPIERIGEVGP